MARDDNFLIVTDLETGKHYRVSTSDPRYSVGMNRTELLMLAKDLEKEEKRK